MQKAAMWFFPWLFLLDTGEDAKALWPDSVQYFVHLLLFHQSVLGEVIPSHAAMK